MAAGQYLADLGLARDSDTANSDRLADDRTDVVAGGAQRLLRIVLILGRRPGLEDVAVIRLLQGVLQGACWRCVLPFTVRTLFPDGGGDGQSAFPARESAWSRD